MNIDFHRRDCVGFIANRISKTKDWRLVQYGLYPGDNRNLLAAQRLAELAIAATAIPDHVWQELKDPYRSSKQKLGEVISATSRNVVFRNDTPDFESYTRNLLANVRATFSN